MILFNRKSIRLKGYDYSSNGAYPPATLCIAMRAGFVTICTQNRVMLFGDIVDGKMETNNLGNLVVSIWDSLPDRFPVIIDTYQIMPNHFHGIIIIDQSVGAPLVGALNIMGAHYGQGRVQDPPLQTLGNIIGAFKSLTTNAWAQNKFWQRNYYEHIIRNEAEFFKIRQYIVNNPQMWHRDRNNLHKFDRMNS